MTPGGVVDACGASLGFALKNWLEQRERLRE